MQWSLHDKICIAHAFFACIATLFTMPIALLAGRYLRSRGGIWLKVHVVSNTITTLLIIIVFGLGVGAVGSQFSGPQSDLHHKVGLVIFLIVVLQAILGYFSHLLPKGHIGRRFHVVFGLIVAAGMYWLTWEGMHNEWPEMSTSMTSTPQSVQILFWVFFLLAVVAYVTASGQLALDTLVVQEVELGTLMDVKKGVDL